MQAQIAGADRFAKFDLFAMKVDADVAQASDFLRQIYSGKGVQAETQALTFAQVAKVPAYGVTVHRATAVDIADAQFDMPDAMLANESERLLVEGKPRVGVSQSKLHYVPVAKRNVLLPRVFWRMYRASPSAVNSSCRTSR